MFRFEPNDAQYLIGRIKYDNAAFLLLFLQSSSKFRPASVLSRDRSQEEAAMPRRCRAAVVVQTAEQGRLSRRLVLVLF